MKKTIHFSKGFIPAVILSIAVIAAGIFCIVTKGINFGLDFKAGLIEEFRESQNNCIRRNKRRGSYL